MADLTNYIDINTGQISQCATVLRTTPIIYMCRNIIHHHLFGNGINFAHRRGRVRPDPHMQEIMTDHWLPCCKQMVDSILATGLVVIRIVNLEENVSIPVLLEPGTCTVKMSYVLGIREYLVVDHEQNVVPDTHVFTTSGFLPTVGGHVNSIVANLLPEISYINTLRGSSLAMEQKRADPIIMTEAVDTKTDSVEGVQYDYYADGDMQDTSSSNKFNRDKTNVQQLAQQQSMYDAFFAGGRPASVGGNVLEKVVALPLGQRIVNMPAQTGRSDVIAQVKMFQDVVCGVMGVPRSLIMADTPHKSDEEGTHQTFQKNILSWKTNIQSICEHIYSIIYAEDIQKQVLAAMGKKRKRAEISDVYALKKRLKVEITFPISPFVSSADMYEHYQRGVISWQTYSENVCSSASLPFEELKEPVAIAEAPAETDGDSD